MTDPRHIHFSCRSTPRIEKQQPPKQVSEQFRDFTYYGKCYAIIGRVVLLVDAFFGVPARTHTDSDIHLFFIAHIL